MVPEAGGSNVAVMSVSVESGTEWKAGSPVRLFEGRYYHETSGIGEGRTYDVSTDGQRFLMIKNVQERDAEVPINLVVVQHLDEELKRFVPTK